MCMYMYMYMYMYSCVRANAHAHAYIPEVSVHKRTDFGYDFSTPNG